MLVVRLMIFDCVVVRTASNLFVAWVVLWVFFFFCLLAGLLTRS